MKLLYLPKEIDNKTKFKKKQPQKKSFFFRKNINFMLHVFKKRPNITKISSTQNTVPIKYHPGKVPPQESTRPENYQPRKVQAHESTSSGMRRPRKVQTY